MSSRTISNEVKRFAQGAPEEGRRVRIIRAPSISLTGLLSDLRRLLEYRDLLYTLSVHRIKVRYKQSALGIAWAVLQPLSLMLIYTVVFSLIARVKSDGAPYAVFAYTALLPWTCFSSALTNATNSLVSHNQLVTKVYFPREILPFTYVIAALFDLLIASVVLGGLLIYYRIPLSLKTLYVLPVVLVLTVLVTGMSLILSALQVRFRDIGVAMPLMLQLWMFASPVVYPLNSVPAQLQILYLLNPMAGIVENFRRAILQGNSLDFHSLGISTVISIILLILSYAYFKYIDTTVADVI